MSASLTHAGSSAEQVLTTHALRVGYSGRAILPPLDWSVRSGDFWAIVGANGSGKTTLLRTLLGLLPVVAGEFRWSERSTVSYVSQRNALDDGVPSRVRDFVAGGLDVGWSFLKWRHGDSGLIRSAMEETKCAHLADEQFMNLSEGQKGRARIARSLVASPSVLVLDEPTSALDSETETAILDTLSHLRRARGLTLLVVSHHTNVFANRATHAVFVDSDRGEVIVGTFDEVVRIRVLLPPDDPAPVAPPATPRSN